jgi:hypothetical protein
MSNNLETVTAPQVVTGDNETLRPLQERKQDLIEARNELVKEYTGILQAQTLPKKVIKLSLELSEKTFQIDIELDRIETELELQSEAV